MPTVCGGLMACDGSRGANNMKRILSLIILSAGTINLTACALVYTAEPMEARVVEAGTQKPLAGVVVVAHWQLVQGTMVGSNLGGQLEVMETVTDPEGRFTFPGFGPKTALGGQYLDDQDPELLIFKSGYESRIVRNDYQGDSPTFRIVHRSQWNGKTIEMKLFPGTETEYAEHVYHLDGDFDDFRLGEDCAWKKIPRMLVALQKMSEQFESKGIKVPGWQVGARIRKVTDVNQSLCGSAEEFFRSYMP
jgi:hypothetical protein